MPVATKVSTAAHADDVVQTQTSTHGAGGRALQECFVNAPTAHLRVRSCPGASFSTAAAGDFNGAVDSAIVVPLISSIRLSIGKSYRWSRARRSMHPWPAKVRLSSRHHPNRFSRMPQNGQGSLTVEARARRFSIRCAAILVFLRIKTGTPWFIFGPPTPSSWVKVRQSALGLDPES